MVTEELKKSMRAIDLAVLAGKKRQSSRTGFIHLHHASEGSDTIPLYENFCFALGLFRQKTAESITEGKKLIERLLAFRSQDNFPVYLHEYPNCVDNQQSLKIAPVFAYLLRHFAAVLGEELKQKIKNALESLQRPVNLFWENRYRAIQGEPLLPFDPSSLSALDWTHWLITCQLAGKTHFELPYDSNLQLFLPKEELQEGASVKPSPIEWLLAEGNYSPRLLKDHKHQIFTALLFPCTYEAKMAPSEHYRTFWENGHSLYAESLIFELEPRVIDRNDIMEASLFVDRGAEICINGRKATTFGLEDMLTIHTETRMFKVRFHLTQGSGDFCGHVFRGNRPNQTHLQGYDAYDWQISLRTLRRSDTAQITIDITEE